MAPKVHYSWNIVKIHTAKCDLCNKHNTDICYRCVECSKTICRSCKSLGKSPDNSHALPGVNNEQLRKCGEIVEPVPHDPRVKEARRARNARRQPEASYDGPAAVRSSPLIERSHNSPPKMSKKRMLDDSDDAEDDDYDPDPATVAARPLNKRRKVGSITSTPLVVNTRNTSPVKSILLRYKHTETC